MELKSINAMRDSTFGVFDLVRGRSTFKVELNKTLVKFDNPISIGTPLVIVPHSFKLINNAAPIRL